MISKAASEHHNARSEHNHVLNMPANEDLRMSSVGNRSHRIVIESDSDECGPSKMDEISLGMQPIIQSMWYSSSFLKE